MDKFRQLKDMLEDELKHIESKGEINNGLLAQADTIAHTLKCLATYEAMEDKGGYSEHYPYRSNSYGYGYGEEGEAAYARGRGRYAKRDSRGRYANDDGESMDYGRRY